MNVAARAKQLSREFARSGTKSPNMRRASGRRVWHFRCTRWQPS